MTKSRNLALALLTGVGLGALGVHTIYAAAKPPVYYIGEIDVTDQTGYLKDFAPKSQAAVKAGGAKFLAIGGHPVGLAGDPPKSRIVIQQWESMEAMKKWFELAGANRAARHPGQIFESAHLRADRPAAERIAARAQDVSGLPSPPPVA